MVVTRPEPDRAVPKADPTSGVPLYLQVERSLEQRIAAGEWRPGEQIPNEAKLGALYDVSRVTMRQAVTRLVQRGMLVREQGRGTFVRDLSLIAGSRRVTSFTTELGELGVKAGSHVLVHEVTTAARAQVAEPLNLEDDARVLCLRRLRTADGTPIGLQTCVLALERFPGLEQLDFEDRSLYATLEEVYGVVALEAYETFTVGGAGPDDAGLLRVPEGSYVFNVERASFDSIGPFEHVRSVMRGDRYKVRLVLRRT